MAITCHTLGSLKISDGERTFSPSGPKTRQVLALLLLNIDTVVSTESIVDELWQDNPPRSVTTTLQTYIYQLRKALRREFSGQDLSKNLVTCTPGYKLCLPRVDIDSTEFENLAARGRTLYGEGRFQQAHQNFESALSLWKGEVLEDVPLGRRLQGHAVRLGELRINTLQFWISSEMRMGPRHDIISELRTLTEQHPLNEWFYGQLMSALAKTGRRGEALEVYQLLRSRLDRDLGLEPSAEIKHFQGMILKGEQRRHGAAGFPASPLDLATIGCY